MREFTDLFSPASNSEEQTASSSDFLPNRSHNPLDMHEANTDTEEFLDGIDESYYSDESTWSLDSLSDGSYDFLESSTDTEESQDHISDSSVSSYSYNSATLWYNLRWPNIWQLKEGGSCMTIRIPLVLNRALRTLK